MSRAGGRAGHSGVGGRPNPYELVFGHELFEEERFPDIAEEARGRGADVSDPEAFLMLASVGALVRALMPEEVRAERGAAGERGEVLRRYGRLLFHAFRHWQEGRPVVGLEEPVARALAEDPAPGAPWRLSTPAPAGYFQLPVNLFWARVGADAPAEPVDGFFWSGSAEAPPARLHVLLALGVRSGRPGFGTLEAAGDTEEAPGGHWADIDARPGGRDFETVLPGGELDRLYSITSAAEVLKLASRAFRHLERRDG